MGKDEIFEIKKKILNITAVHPGKISQQYTVCNKKNCACKDKKNPKKHGPYYQLSYSIKGKSSTKFIKPEQVDQVENYIKEYKKLKTLFNDLTEAYVKKFKENGWD